MDAAQIRTCWRANIGMRVKSYAGCIPPIRSGVQMLGRLGRWPLKTHCHSWFHWPLTTHWHSWLMGPQTIQSHSLFQGIPHSTLPLFFLFEIPHNTVPLCISGLTPSHNTLPLYISGTPPPTLHCHSIFQIGCRSCYIPTQPHVHNTYTSAQEIITVFVCPDLAPRFPA